MDDVLSLLPFASSSNKDDASIPSRSALEEESAYGAPNAERAGNNINDGCRDDDDRDGAGDATNFGLLGGLSCRCIEEASVHTTIESMQEIANDDEPVWVGINKYDASSPRGAQAGHEPVVVAGAAKQQGGGQMNMVPELNPSAVVEKNDDVDAEEVVVTKASICYELCNELRGEEVSATISWDHLLPPQSNLALAAASLSALSSSTMTHATKYNVKLRLTPVEERIFRLLVEAAEAYEAGLLTPEPYGEDAEESVSLGGGFSVVQQPKKERLTELMKNVDDRRMEGNGDDGVVVVGRERNVVGIRVAGGWVRDKLLHQHSDDVDVALDCMMGVEFARVVQSYMALSLSSDVEEEDGDNDLEGIGEERRLKRRPAGRGRRHPKIGVIGANPSQSKHLETATMKIHGIDVDFVNLRANEVYGADSRIPTFGTTTGSLSGAGELDSRSCRPPSFGAPLEDALRRDFTINSLFFNVRTGKIEDWTGRGLDDLLRRRLVVTPVDPHVTFHDDPLRVLRAIRFAVRLDFALDASIVEAAKSKRVHRSLHAKVSRERVGKELEGMLSGKHARPGRALDAIARLHLAGSVFAFPGKFPGDRDHVGGPVTGRILGVEYKCDMCASARASADVDVDDVTPAAEVAEVASRQRARGWEESRMLLSVLPNLIKGHVDEREKMAMTTKVANVVSLSSADQRLLYLCVFILPFYDLTFPDTKGRKVTVTSHMVKEAIKFPQRDAQSVSKILSHIDEMVTLLSKFRLQLASTLSIEKEAGAAPGKLTPPCRLRVGLLLRSLKEQWVTCLIAAAAWEIRTYLTPSEGDNEEGIATPSIAADQPVRKLYRAIVEDLDLDGCWSMRPHLNGKEIIKELGLQNGPLVGMYVEDQTRWMLLNPLGTKEECVTHLRACKTERDGDCIDTSVEGQGKDQSSPTSERNMGAENSSKKCRVEN